MSNVSLFDYYAARAPDEIPDWFEKDFWDRLKRHIRRQGNKFNPGRSDCMICYFEWRVYYAKKMLRFTEEEKRKLGMANAQHEGLINYEIDKDKD